MKFYRLTTILIACISFTSTHAQQKWNLKTVVEYAMANNLTVKLSDVLARTSAINYKQSKLSQIPSLNFSTNGSLNSGSNQDPVSFSRITQSYVAASMQLQSSGEIFNFFSKRNAIAAYGWELEANKAGIAKAKNDIALTAANGYLQVLLALEQQKITAVQIDQTRAQLLNIRKQVDAGALPELNAAQLESQLATDSVTYITAKGNVEQAILLLKSYMNIGAEVPFEVEAPPVESIPLESIADLQPDMVYKLALVNQPLQHVNDFKLKAAQKNVLAAKGALLPTLSGFGSLGSAFNNQALEITSTTTVLAPVGNVIVGGNSYDVFPLVPFKSYSYGKTKFSNQLSDNFRQSVGLNLSIPIFSGWSLKANYEKSKLNVETARLQKAQDDLKLQQDIYQAYNAAMVSMKKFNAVKKSVEVNEVTYNYALKRSEVGMLNTYDLITSQNNLLKARLEYSLSQFDYVFKMKVLEFYKGQGLKL